MASGLIPGTPVGQLFSRSSQPTTPTLQDIQENNLGGVSSGHAIPQLHPENSHGLATEISSSRKAKEPNWNRKPEPPEPFSKNRNRTFSLPQRNRPNRKLESPEPFHTQTGDGENC